MICFDQPPTKTSAEKGGVDLEISRGGKICLTVLISVDFNFNRNNSAVVAEGQQVLFCTSLD